MANKLDCHSGTKPADAMDLAELLTALEKALTMGAEQDREAAIVKIRNLGIKAWPILPAIAKAIADQNDLVNTNAFYAFSSLCPQVSEQFPDLWRRVSNCDEQVRLPAVEELVKILAAGLLEAVKADKDRRNAVTEDFVQPSHEDFMPENVQGKWIAWNDNQEAIVATADTFPELMSRIAQMGFVDPVIERAPGLHPAVVDRPFQLLDGESSNILEDVRATIPEAEQWLDTPNTRLWCKKPRELIGTPQERQLRYLVRGLWSGITS